MKKFEYLVQVTEMEKKVLAPQVKVFKEELNLSANIDNSLREIIRLNIYYHILVGRDFLTNDDATQAPPIFLL